MMFALRDRQFMQHAIELALEAEASNEVPVGAVLVRDDEILASAHNLTRTHNDPSAHAEIQVLREAGRLAGSPRLTDTTLYVTVEPCVMCVGAIVQARVKRLVYGAREPRTGAVASAFEILMSERHNHRVVITEGVLGDHCLEPLQRFFKQRRNRSS
ncbi:MAG: tRNA adenosine(34) deaminase TadA [Gammaproteobacteria bacterium]|nr:tRNA adenosine(34) deaminase TadA [Gammaproteobacteria bacterium]